MSAFPCLPQHSHGSHLWKQTIHPSTKEWKKNVVYTWNVTLFRLKAEINPAICYSMVDLEGHYVK